MSGTIQFSIKDHCQEGSSYHLKFKLGKGQRMESTRTRSSVVRTGQRNGFMGLLKGAWLPFTLLNTCGQGSRWLPHPKVMQDSLRAWRPPPQHKLSLLGNPIAYCVSSTLFLKVSVWLSAPQRPPAPLLPDICKQSKNVHWVSTGG